MQIKAKQHMSGLNIIYLFNTHFKICFLISESVCVSVYVYICCIYMLYMFIFYYVYYVCILCLAFYNKYRLYGSALLR